jgi:hypothetical protein
MGDLSDTLFFGSCHVEKGMVCGIQRLPSGDAGHRVRIHLRSGGFVDLQGGFSYEAAMKVWQGDERSHALLQEDRLTRVQDALLAYVSWARGTTKKEKAAIEALAYLCGDYGLDDIADNLRQNAGALK